MFCANKEHMDEMVSHVPEWFAGVNPDVVVYEAYSDNPNTDKAFADFKTDISDRLKLLFCIDMLNEGVHVEGISGVILFRPTISPIIYKQQIGRALTAGDTAAPLILDVVNNFEGLTSISGLQSEMQEAVHRLYANGEGDKIVTERFEVIEQVHDCRVLFEQLQASLSSGWEHYFSEASIYYAEHGNLNVPKLYTTPGGLSLGVWLVTQRRVREGQIQGNLTEQQIARLDSIGMVWGNRKEIAWQHGFEVAKKYHDTYGNLMVPGKYTDPDGYPLGQWIIKTRQQKLNGRLKEERIAQLDEIGMVWNIFDAKWEKAYALAAAYYEENGNLNIPRSYVTAAGERLGQWVASQQWAYPKGKLTDEQVERLNRIEMYWGNRNDRQWNEGYQEAKRYFDAHGDLNDRLDVLQIPVEGTFVYENYHIYDVICLAAGSLLSVVPVLDRKNNFVGSITLTDILRHLDTLLCVDQPGGILVLEVNRIDYSLAEVAQIVEYNEARVLSCYVSGNRDSQQLQITLKINTLNVDPILDTFIRYGYTVKNSFVTGEEEQDSLRERYGLLMKYLEL